VPLTGDRRVALVVNPTRASAKELADRAQGWWQAHGYDVVVDDGSSRTPPDLLDRLDFAVSLGGDGTMLRTVQSFLELDVPVLGVNFGNLGYLTQVEPSGIAAAFERLVAGDYDVEERMTLSVNIRGAASVGDASREERGATYEDRETGGGTGTQLNSLVALNEVVVEKAAPGRTIRVAASISGRPFLTFAADGIIVATPTGSTAYNLSARGPIVSPHLRAIVVTPISPHMLFDRSLVLEPDETVGLELIDGRPAVLTVDGSTVATLGPDTFVEVVAGPRPARIVRFGRPDFHAILRAKFSLQDR